MTTPSWPAIELARACRGPARVPFVLVEGGVERTLGSMAIAHLADLRDWPDAFEALPGDPAAPPGAPPRALALRLPAGARDERLAAIHAELRRRGLIRAWRDEPYPLRDRVGGEHATIERAASRFWGTLTLGAHCNGYVADADGRPTHLWIARRSASKPTDPGRLDNLVGGGVALGQTPREALVREGWEEAGLRPAQMAGLVEGSLIELDCDIAEGRQHEWLHVFDLALAPDVVPRNTDGEVAEHLLLPLAEALARAAAGELTTDAALATFDFAWRRGLIEPSGASAAQTQSFERLRIPRRVSPQGFSSCSTIQSP
jgi:8-oxo-dGTP pyrophosphatase MutT (NUDIX family)